MTSACNSSLAQPRQGASLTYVLLSVAAFNTLQSATTSRFCLVFGPSSLHNLLDKKFAKRQVATHRLATNHFAIQTHLAPRWSWNAANVKKWYSKAGKTRHWPGFCFASPPNVRRGLRENAHSIRLPFGPLSEEKLVEVLEKIGQLGWPHGDGWDSARRRSL